MIVDDVPMGVLEQDTVQHIQLLMLGNDVSLQLNTGRIAQKFWGLSEEIEHIPL